MRDGFWFGQYGMLVPIVDVRDSLSVAPQQEITITRTIGGGSFGVIQQGAPRQWDVSLSGLSPTQAAQVRVVLSAMAPPYVWVTPWAARTNLLTPAQSLLEGIGSPAGVYALADGGFAPSIVSPPTVLASGIPVVPNVPLVVSFYARATSVNVTPSIEWFDGTGASITVANGFAQSPAPSGPLGRVFTKFTPPASAVKASIRQSGASRVAAPAATFTDAPVEWGIGDGCLSVLASTPSTTPSVISERTGGPRAAGISFTVYEVG